MRLTKLDMARVIVMALYNLTELPAGDHPQVAKLARRKVATLTRQHAMAMRAIQSRPDFEAQCHASQARVA